MEMKGKVGGVAYVAYRKRLDGKAIEQDILPTINGIKKLLPYLEAVDVGDSNQTMFDRKLRIRKDQGLLHPNRNLIAQPYVTALRHSTSKDNGEDIQ